MDNLLIYNKISISPERQGGIPNLPFMYDLRNILPRQMEKYPKIPTIAEFYSPKKYLLTKLITSCMTYGMASITKKMIRGKPYYYARECKRVNGKPKIVWQQYLGRPEDIINAMTRGPLEAEAMPKPKEAIIVEFGAVTALYDLAKRLELSEHIDRHVPKQGQGPTVGEYLLVAILNRCVAPCSKSSIAKWFQGTVLRRIMELDSRQLSSQRFWENMDRVTRQAIESIERDITIQMVRDFAIDLKHVLFDGTNFFTFIDTFNERSTLAQRGKSKEGRRALRIVGLALLVSADFHVPLFHRTYPGNQVDAPTFSSLTEELVRRYREITDGAEHVTIIFDKGNNSQDNLQAIEESPYHFIGSLVPTQHPDLLAIPDSMFRPLDEEGLPGVQVYRCRREVFKAQRTVLVTYNENLFVAQSRTLLREIAKRQKLFRQIQYQLRRHREGKVRGGNPPTLEGVSKKVQGWLKARHMKELFQVQITKSEGLPKLTYRFDNRAWEQLQATLLGKTILFTDNDHWSDVEIIRGYRSQHHVETAFRRMKDCHHIALRPQYHWTDQKVEVHVFCCVLALMLCSLLRRELHRKGIDRSIPDLLDELAIIHEVGIVYPPQVGQELPTIQTTLSQMTEEQRSLYEALNLERYCSRSVQVIRKCH
jgi:transposase